MTLKKGLITVMLNLILITVVGQSLSDLKEVAKGDDPKAKLEVIKKSWKQIEKQEAESDGYSLGVGAMQIDALVLLASLVEENYKPAKEFIHDKNLYKQVSRFLDDKYIKKLDKYRKSKTYKNK